MEVYIQKNTIIRYFFISIYLLLFSCKTDLSPPSSPELALSDKCITGDMLRCARKEKNLYNTLTDISKNKPINWAVAPYNQALNYAVRNFSDEPTSYTSIIRLLLEKGAPVTSTILHRFLYQPKTEPQLANLVIKHADTKMLNSLTDPHHSPLILAVTKGNLALVQALIKQGANINFHDQHHCNALDFAIKQSKKDIAECLIKAGAKIDLLTLHEAFNQPNKDLAILVIQHTPLQVINNPSYLHNPLLTAIQKRDTILIQSMIQQGADINLQDKKGNMALRTAIEVVDTYDRSILKFLLKQGATMDAQLLWDIVQQDSFNPKIMHLLLKSAIPDTINTRNELQQTPLMVAVIRGDLGLTQLLIQQQAKLELKDSQGNTALSLALTYGRIEIAQLLLKQGASIHQQLLWHFLEKPAANPQSIQLLIQAFFPRPTTELDTNDNAACTEEITLDALIIKNKALKQVIKNGYTDAAIYLFEQDMAKQGNWVIYDIASGLTSLTFDSNNHTWNHFLYKAINSKDHWKYTPLMYAVFNQNIPAIKKLLAYGADVNVAGNNGETALNIAIVQGSLEIVNILLERGAKVALHTIHDSITIKKFEMAALLLTHAPFEQINRLDYTYDTLLISAIQANAYSLVKQLLQQGANINLPNILGDTPLYVAIQNKRKNIALHLIHHGAQIDIKAYTLALEQDNQDLLQSIISHTPANLMDQMKTEALLKAAEQGEMGIIQPLLKARLDINKKNEWKENALHLALKNKHISVALYLIKQGISIDQNALCLAIKQKHIDLCQLMIHQIPPQTIQGSTQSSILLTLAVSKGALDIVQLLLDAGVQITPQAFLEAARRPAMDILSLLKSQANINLQDAVGKTALMYAAEIGNLDAVKQLIQKGADPAIQDRFGQTALTIAIKKNHRAIVKYLLTQPQ